MENNNSLVPVGNNLPEKKDGILTKAKNAIAKGAQQLSAKALAPYKNFFFTELQAGKEFQDCEKAIGKIHTVTIAISKVRTFMRSESATEKVDTEFTDEEKTRMLKTWRVKESTVEACKSIFIIFYIDKQKIDIHQNKLDGTKKTISL